MKSLDVVFRPLAASDLFDLYDYIRRESGTAVAGAYIDRIEMACRALGTFPERGSARDDIRPGLRTLGFERRVTIAFHVSEDLVTIVRVLYGGRSLERNLQDSTDGR